MPKMPRSYSILNDETEAAFQNWYSKWAKITGINPNPDDPRHYYDYRSAFLANATPSISYLSKNPEWHWPSIFKIKGHPRMILNGTNTKTGRKIP